MRNKNLFNFGWIFFSSTSLLILQTPKMSFFFYTFCNNFLSLAVCMCAFHLAGKIDYWTNGIERQKLKTQLLIHGFVCGFSSQTFVTCSSFFFVVFCRFLCLNPKWEKCSVDFLYSSRWFSFFLLIFLFSSWNTFV